MIQISRFAAVVCLVTMLSGFALAKPPLASAPEQGAKAIDFKLPIAGTDETLKLSDQYKQGSVVVIVLRGFPGYQCPLCSRQVGALRNRAKKLAENAHKVILVYPGEADALQRHAEEFLGSRTLPEPMVMVRDPDMKMVTDWGLRWNAPRETAYPATFVIDQEGTITWEKVSESHAGRTTAEEVLLALKKQ